MANANATGHIRKRKEGLFEGQYWFEDKRRSVYGNSKDDVRVRLNEIYAGILSETHIESSSESLNSYLNHWLITYAEPTVRPSTYINYKTYVQKHIYPELGEIQLRKVTTPLLQDFLNKKRTSGRLDGKEGGLSSKTILNIRNMLSSAFGQAVTNRLLRYNPVSGVKLVHNHSPEARVFSTSEVKALIEHLNKQNHMVALATLVLLNTGLRQGELLALRWADVDLLSKSIAVRNTLGRIYHPTDSNTEYSLVSTWANKSDKTGIYLGPVKTPKARRTVYLNNTLLDIFEQIKVLQREQKQALDFSDSEFNPQGFVFTNELGRVLGSCQVQKHFKRFVKEAGLSEANVHATRHTFATIALSRSKDVNTVSAILGHAKPSTTLDMYGHTFDDRMRGVMDMMDD